MNNNENKFETMPAALISLLAEGVAVTLMFAAAFVWLALYGTL